MPLSGLKVKIGNHNEKKNEHAFAKDDDIR